VKLVIIKVQMNKMQVMGRGIVGVSRLRGETILRDTLAA
jgi:hypothetical protein